MNKYKAIFFDLDGTLLPMELDDYIKKYFYTLSKKLEKNNLDSKKILEAIQIGLHLMINNEGLKTNEEIFWDGFNKIIPNSKEKYTKILLDYYYNEYNEIAKDIVKYPELSSCLKLLKEKGYLIICATNPLYPKEATFARLKWAGLDESYFDYITSYENSSYSKPNINYFIELLNKFSLTAPEVIMIGNDVQEDLVFKELKATTYLINNYLRNKENLKIITDYQGSFLEFLKFVKENL